MPYAHPLANPVGAIVVLAVLGMQWDLAHTTRLFHQFATRVFPDSTDGRRLPLCSLVQSLAKSGHYSAECLVSAFQECFGDTRQLFGYPIGGVSRCKFAFTATTIDSTSTVLFPSYNPFLDRTGAAVVENEGKKLATCHLFPRDRPEMEPLLPEV